MILKRKIIIAVLFLFFDAVAYGKQYYVDAVKGNDKNNGVNQVNAWQTLKKVSNTFFQPGDIISFKAGQRFVGLLSISSSGKKNLPIIYTSYGNGEFAIIDGNGDSTAVYSYNKEYIVMNKLTVTNFRKGSIAMNDLFNGILILNEDAGTLHNFHFDNIRVYNVNSTYIAKDEGKTDQSRFHGGVQFYTRGNKVRSHFDDVLITNSTFENLSRTGFNFRSDWDDRSAYSKFGDSLSNGSVDNWTPNTKVIFRENYFKNIAGNGLIVRVAADALIEHNVFDSCGKIISGNAVFNFNTDNTIYQFNEAKNTIYSAGETDARGIDSDYRTKNTIIQYNYLHNNGLGGVTAVGGPGAGDDPVNFNLGTVIRYNILENNARQGAYFSGRVEGLQVYNNVFYANADNNNVVAIKLNRWTVYPNGSSFRNNIFYYEGSNITYEFTMATNVVFDHNIYFGLKPPSEFPDKFPLEANPLFNATGTGMGSYKLLKNSAAIKAGVMISGNGGKDYFGNTIDNTLQPNIGIDAAANLK